MPEQEWPKCWYYIQDKRQYVGNCVLWWGPNNNGYTTEIDAAGRYTREQAIAITRNRRTDIAWPEHLVKMATVAHVRIERLRDFAERDGEDAGGWTAHEEHDSSYRCLMCGKPKRTNNTTWPHCRKCAAEIRNSKCSWCGEEGHNQLTCELNVGSEEAKRRRETHGAAKRRRKKEREQA